MPDKRRPVDVLSASPQETPYHAHGLGWRHSLPDARDMFYAYPQGVAVPDELDLRTVYSPTVYDQGALGSCTANAGAYAFQYADYFNNQRIVLISRLFEYYQERVIERSTGYDAGAEMRDVFKAMKRYGVVPEVDYPYDTSLYADAPPARLYTEARADRLHKYERVHQVRSLMQACLAAKRTFILGISVYESFESSQAASTGIVPMPDLQTERLLGGHAVCCVGYSTAKQCYICLNSWGAQWGDHGSFYLPFQYAESPLLAGDIWTITTL